MKHVVALTANSPEESSRVDIHRLIEHVTHWLPAQGPIKDFIHHNTLHAFQDQPFHDGISVASQLFGARDYFSLQEFRSLYKEGKISDAAVRKALERFDVPSSEHGEWHRKMLDESNESATPQGLVKSGIRKAWSEKLEIELDNLVHPILFRLLGGFLDQGMSLWRMPNAAEESFWKCVGDLASHRLFPIIPLNDPKCRELFQKEPIEAIELCLNELVGHPSYYETYIAEMLLAHPGWSGMVNMVEKNPLSLHAPRRVSVVELVAVDLILELGWIRKRVGRSFTKLNESLETRPLSPSHLQPLRTETAKLTQIWQEAYEWTLYQDVLKALETFHHVPRTEPTQPFAQTFHCIDDRETGVRRFLEETDPSVQTFGSAGFFGLDFYFQAADSRYAIQHCPVVIKPQHLVREIDDHYTPKSDLASLFQVTPSHNTLFRGWLLTQTLGVWASIKLFFNVFRPGFNLLTSRKMTSVKPPTRLQILREGNEKSPEGHWLGYSIPELVDRVYNVFKSSGLTENFAELVVMYAHGSSSANNPHFAAYDCGACSGKPGAPNARAFAWVANHPDVRAGLRAKGLHLPDSTYVLGALHDTARDEITYFDLLSLPATHQIAFKRLHAAMTQALERNAKERCRRFELVSTSISPAEAHRHVRQRAQSIFEPRPEMNHMNNALAIVGRRSLTRGLFFDRRAFLNSYDPTKDPQGDTLAGILNAVIPVCGGINLEYFFSRVDPSVYGSGTKLPHNVMALVGVANGVEGDLQTGLPTQMTELHDPVRLLIVVEQETEIALKALKKNPTNFAWVEKEWVFYASASPTTKKIHVWEKAEWKPLTGLDDYKLPVAPDSLTAIKDKTGNIKVHQVGTK